MFGWIKSIINWFRPKTDIEKLAQFVPEDPKACKIDLLVAKQFLPGKTIIGRPSKPKPSFPEPHQLTEDECDLIIISENRLKKDQRVDGASYALVVLDKKKIWEPKMFIKDDESDCTGKFVEAANKYINSKNESDHPKN